MSDQLTHDQCVTAARIMSNVAVGDPGEVTGVEFWGEGNEMIVRYTRETAPVTFDETYDVVGEFVFSTLTTAG